MRAWPAIIVATMLATAASAGTPRRIVSMAPSITETLAVLGLSDRLAGISSYCQLEGGEDLPRVGGYLNPEVETILSLEPDLVLTPPNPSLESALGSMEIPYHVIQQQWTTVRDILDSIVQIGHEVGADSQGVSLAEEIRSGLDAVHAEAAELPRLRVLTVIEHQPGVLVAAGPGSHLDELAAAAGLDNVLADGPPYPSIPTELAAVLDPDLVIEMVPGAESTDTRMLAARWKGHPLGKLSETGRILFMDPKHLSIPGPGIAKAARKLLEAGKPFRTGLYRDGEDAL